MGRKIVCSFTLDPEVLEDAKELAEKERRSLSSLVESAIVKMLGR